MCIIAPEWRGEGKCEAKQAREAEKLYVEAVRDLSATGPHAIFELQARSGGTGRRAGLKIQWYLVPCGFDPLLRDHFGTSRRSQMTDQHKALQY